MKLRMKPIIIVALGTISKSIVKRMEELGNGGRAKNIQTAATSRSARILRRDLETSETCCPSDSS